ncbi:helix-turn-helix domain-containing protein [Kitasatospora mediocidica]|uniref:helix-turn-helix domain-containing protein n=1 Tax=Kitasatospora mediocidica TaxID=58352 RepID=UPI000A031C2E|nr:helix-turn-helix transcriptional regulator [Kitasatospora mediocidica]
MAAHLGWSEDRVRCSLDVLARLALVRHSEQQPGYLLLVNPEVSLASLISRQETDLAERQRQIAGSRLEAAKLIAQYADSHRVQRNLGVEQLSGVDEIRLRLEELSHSCTSEIMGFATGGGQSAAARAASQAADKEVFDRGVQMRSVYLESSANDSGTTAHLDWLTSMGGRVRVAPSLPMRMVIFDREVAVVPTNPDDTGVGALVLHGSGLVSALCALFEHVWEAAAPYGSRMPHPGNSSLSPQARAVLSLLAQGHTDEVVARKLGVSVRTSRRITAELMAELGGRSRFQAGVIAGERGLLQGMSLPPRNGAGVEAE